MNTKHLKSEGLILLQAAILEQAIHDYKIELKCADIGLKNGFYPNGGKRCQEDTVKKL
jgi:hypothetical protein